MAPAKISAFAYVSAAAMALLAVFAIVTVATWPSPLGPRNAISVALALLLVAELAMAPLAVGLYRRLPGRARMLSALGLLALAASLGALLVLVWAYLAQTPPPNPHLVEWVLGAGAGSWLLLSNQLARATGVLGGPLPWIGSLAGCIWLLDPLNGFHMIAETTSVLGFLVYAAWATRLARAR
jgi:hypothetical protein